MPRLASVFRCGKVTKKGVENGKKITIKIHAAHGA